MPIVGIEKDTNGLQIGDVSRVNEGKRVAQEEANTEASFKGKVKKVVEN